jgi:CheY-like chemotaxis protein
VVEEMAHLLAAAISKKAVLRFELERELPAVEADATQLRQLVMNLITNASDAIGEDNGVIVVRTGTMRADRAYLAGTWAGEALDEGSYVYMEVADTGAGMDDETRARIFEPFFTTKFTGRGLGMAGALGIVRGHGGAVRVDSAPGRGTVVRVLLPGVDAPAVVPPGVPSLPNGSPEPRGTVLVVDDEEAVRSVARVVLERSGFTVLTACDGLEGLETFRARASEIDVLLLDLTMPVLSGEEVLAAVRAERPDTRVVLSSGYTEEETRTRLANGTATRFIQKPYRPAQLVEIMRDALRV